MSIFLFLITFFDKQHMKFQAHAYWNGFFLLTICSQDDLEDSEIPLILVTKSGKLEQAKEKDKVVQSSWKRIYILHVLIEFFIALHFINIYY